MALARGGGVGGREGAVEVVYGAWVGGEAGYCHGGWGR